MSLIESGNSEEIPLWNCKFRAKTSYKAIIISPLEYVTSAGTSPWRDIVSLDFTLEEAPSCILKGRPIGAKFTPLLHFIKKYKVPWILKWQYAKEDDVLARCWYVKWWDKFAHTDSIINNVSKDFRHTERF